MQFASHFSACDADFAEQFLAYLACSVKVTSAIGCLLLFHFTGINLQFTLDTLIISSVS